MVSGAVPTVKLVDDDVFDVPFPSSPVTVKL